jgi:hypothetical protein
VHAKENPGFRVGDLTLLADVEFGPNIPNSDLAVKYLERIDGIPELMSYFRPVNSTEKDSVYYVGSGKSVTRQRILDSLSQAIEKARRVLEIQRRVVFVVYVSAHGWLGPDGRPYLLPADADADDPKTWISYEEFLQPIYAFLAQENKIGPFFDPVRGDLSRVGIVIFDTCQFPRSGELDKVPATPDLSRLGLVVVQATSPGRYAWHWTESLTSKGNITVEKETRWGFPPPPKAKRGPLATSLSMNMSVLPVASQMVLNEKTSPPETEDRMISVSEWVGGTAQGVEVLLAKIPEAMNPELKGATGQKVQIQSNPRQYDFWILQQSGAKSLKSPYEQGAEPQ